jgi:hypothetical protein
MSKSTTVKEQSGTGKSGRTTVRIGRSKVPRLPHERDESSDRADPEPTPQMRRAAADVEAGRVDTDKGPVLDSSYRKLRDKPPR